MPKSRTREYAIRTTFRAPVPFVFAWCTDYSAKDAEIEGEEYERRVISRERSRVVYEDLEKIPGGWSWSHWNIRLSPPRVWRAEAIGNYRSWRLEYRLRSLDDGRTELTIRGRRTPMLLGTKNPARSELEGDLRKAWRKFGRALEADYRRSLR